MFDAGLLDITVQQFLGYAMTAYVSGWVKGYAIYLVKRASELI